MFITEALPGHPDATPSDGTTFRVSLGIVDGLPADLDAPVRCESVLCCDVTVNASGAESLVAWI